MFYRIPCWFLYYKTCKCISKDNRVVANGKTYKHSLSLFRTVKIYLKILENQCPLDLKNVKFSCFIALSKLQIFYGKVRKKYGKGLKIKFFKIFKLYRIIQKIISSWEINLGKTFVFTYMVRKLRGQGILKIYFVIILWNF